MSLDLNTHTVRQLNEPERPTAPEFMPITTGTTHIATTSTLSSVTTVAAPTGSANMKSVDVRRVYSMSTQTPDDDQPMMPIYIEHEDITIVQLSGRYMMSPRVGYSHLGVPRFATLPNVDWAGASKGLIMSNFKELELCAKRRFMLGDFYRYVERFSLPNSVLGQLIQEGRRENANMLAAERSDTQLRAWHESFEQEYLAPARAQANYQRREREEYANEVQRTYQSSEPEPQPPAGFSLSDSMSSFDSESVSSASISWFSPSVLMNAPPNSLSQTPRPYTSTRSETSGATGCYPVNIQPCHGMSVSPMQGAYGFPPRIMSPPRATHQWSGMAEGTIYLAIMATPSSLPPSAADRVTVDYNHPSYQHSFSLHSLAAHRELLNWVNLQQVDIIIGYASSVHAL